MKKKNKKNHIRTRFSTLLLCILAFVLCAAPSVCGEDYFGLNYASGEYNVTEELVNIKRDEVNLDKGDLDWLYVGGGTEVTTVNLYVYISDYVFAASNSVLNIYTGYSGNNVDDDSYNVFISPDKPYAVVTVYGTDFAVSAEKSHWVSDDQVVIHGIGELTGTDVDGYPINLTFYCPGDENVPIKLKAPASKEVKEVEIDIKPGGNPNNINLRSKGVVPVAVLTTGDFNANTIDPTTVKFAGASPVRWTLCDVDGDGDDDMMFHFKTQNLKLDENSTESTLTAMLIGTMTSTMTSETTAGDLIQGTDEVCIKPGKKEK